jgi:hypothetical protein
MWRQIARCHAERTSTVPAIKADGYRVDNLFTLRPYFPIDRSLARPCKKQCRQAIHGIVPAAHDEFTI